MGKKKVGLFGFGKTGKAVANEILNSEHFALEWVVRQSSLHHHKHASRFLGYESDKGDIFSVKDVKEDFFDLHPVDIIIDFSDKQGVYSYEQAAKQGIPILSAISFYDNAELDQLKKYAEMTAVLYSPNITLGVNVLLVAAQILQKIAPHADIEIVEEHFKEKPEVSGTAKRIAKALNLDVQKHLHSVRVGGIVGRHEIIFGMPNQTIRLSHESINRGAFGQGAIFAAEFLLDQPPGLYTMEALISKKFQQNIPVY